MKAILISGNGGASPTDHWLPYLERELPKIGIEVINKQFPDPELARKEYWLPFIKKLGADEDTVLIGHSSGAVAAMRYAEDNKILGSVLVGVSYTDLDDEDEKKSQYFNSPWRWEEIKNNQNWIIQFGSIDDPYIPIKQFRYIHDKLNSEYHEFADEGHFGSVDSPKAEFPELVEALKDKLQLQ